MSDAALSADDLCRQAERFWARAQPAAALQAAWAAFDLDPSRRATKRLVARLLHHHPAELKPDRLAAYLTLLSDPEIEPDRIGTAGWRLLLSTTEPTENDGDDAHGTLIASLQRDNLGLTLLRESPVYFAPAERLLSRLRRWLLLSGQWRSRPELIEALKIQGKLNGGAWPFDEAERAALAMPENGPMAVAYIPIRRQAENAAASKAADPVTRAVAAQYEAWPYPAWTRITVRDATRLPDVVADMDGEMAKALPVAAHILIAGCGTGRQAAYVAASLPDAMVTAIDISEASLAYARRQCAALKITNVRFHKLDLHDVAQLETRFHAIHCAGVLHHLSEPERGFKLLADALHPDGVMRIMVYNRVQRLVIAAARALIADLVQEPMSDDLLRRVRERVLQQPEQSFLSSVTRSADFATLAGVHDLLLHRHEDPFDVMRIERALDHAGLRMLSFSFPTPPVAARYDAAFPDDPRHRDTKALASFTRSDPVVRAAHFRFWCCKSLH